jgi:hypothetical protein
VYSLPGAGFHAGLPERGVMLIMIVRCQNCGNSVVASGLGRKPLNIPLKNILEELRRHRSVKAAAHELNCSQGYIFNALKAHGIRLKDVIATF